MKDANGNYAPGVDIQPAALARVTRVIHVHKDPTNQVQCAGKGIAVGTDGVAGRVWKKTTTISDKTWTEVSM
jgi:hypothetical protein